MAFWKRQALSNFEPPVLKGW